MNFSKAKEIFETPFMDLLYKAHTIHKANFTTNKIQFCTLLSIQTGGCSEDCAYCAQSSRNSCKIQVEKITDINEILKEAKEALSMKSTRFCLGSSGGTPSKELIDFVCIAIKEIKKLGLKACLTLGSLNERQVIKLKESGLDFYNHNIDTSPQHYKNIITTRSIEERLNTLKLLQKHDIKVCTGGILGIGENNEDRINMLLFLKKLDKDPNLITINRLVKIPGTPLENAQDIDSFDFVRFVALARILMPHSYVKLCAGRETMSEELQTLCFFAGANSIFIGKKLLTTKNSKYEDDLKFLNKINLTRRCP